MAENRRRINIGKLPGEESGRETDRTLRTMEDQLRVQEQLVSAERERRLALQNTGEQQEIVSRNIVETRAAFVEMHASADKSMTATGSGFKNLFRTVFKGELNSAKDNWDSFCSFLTNSFLNAAAKIASSGFEKMLEGLFGSLSPQTGGAGNVEIKRAASSSAAVSTGGGGDPGRQALNVEVKIDNQSSAPLKIEQGPVSHGLDKLVIGIVARDITEYGELGKLIRNQRRG